MFKDESRYLSHPSVQLMLFLAFTFIREGKTSPPAVQQNACRVLGVLDYNAHPHGLLPAVDFLLSCVDKPVR